jgi:hypothetical protein
LGKLSSLCFVRLGAAFQFVLAFLRGIFETLKFSSLLHNCRFLLVPLSLQFPTFFLPAIIFCFQLSLLTLLPGSVVPKIFDLSFLLFRPILKLSLLLPWPHSAPLSDRE